MDIRDIAWAAGIYEGEGCFGGKPGIGRYVHVTQKDRWLCFKLQSLFGGSVRKDGVYYRWTICGDTARGFLLTIFTLLSPWRKKVILEDKDFFLKTRCLQGLHDWVQPNIGVEFTSTRGRREFCRLCRVAHDVRSNTARRAKWANPEAAANRAARLQLEKSRTRGISQSVKQQWVVQGGSIDEQFAFLDKIS